MDRHSSGCSPAEKFPAYVSGRQGSKDAHHEGCVKAVSTPDGLFLKWCEIPSTSVWTNPKVEFPLGVITRLSYGGLFRQILAQEKAEVEFNEKRNTANAACLHSCLDAASRRIRAADSKKSIQPASKFATCANV